MKAFKVLNFTNYLESISTILFKLCNVHVCQSRRTTLPTFSGPLSTLGPRQIGSKRGEEIIQCIGDDHVVVDTDEHRHHEHCPANA